MIRVLSEFDKVVLISNEEFAKFTEYSHSMNLVGIWWGIEDLFGHMNWISDNDNLRYIFLICGLVNTVSDCKEFYFSISDMNHMVEDLDNRIISNIYMQYKCSNIVFDASIYDDDGNRQGICQLNDYVVKLLETNFILFFII